MTRKAAWRFVLDLLARRDKCRLAVLFALMLLNSLGEMVSVGMIVPFLTVASVSPERQAEIGWLRTVHQILGIDDHRTLVLVMGFGLVVIFILRSLFLAFVQFYQYRFIWRSRAETAIRFYQGYLEMPIPFHMRRGGSEVVRNLVQAVQDLFVGMVMPTIVLVSEVTVVMTLACLLMAVDPWMTLAAGVSMALTVLVMHSFVSLRLRRWGEISNTTTHQMIKHVTQSLHGIKEVKVFGREAWFEDEFRRLMQANSTARERNNAVMQYPRLALETLVVMGVVVAVMVLTRSGSLVDQLPMLGLFGMAAIRLMPSFNRINVQLGSLRFSEHSLVQLAQDWAEFGRNRAANVSAEGGKLPFERELEVRGVSLRYAGAEHDALSHLSFTIQKGETIGLVGPSGSGKSSIINLLTGLLTPSQGAILADGVSIAGQERRWQAEVALIPQDVFILDDTLAANVAFGRAGRADDEARLNEALTVSRLDEVVARLPQGADTVVGERGGRLSGGERQRIGIARALFNDADVLVFDEATSALDAETEAAITEEIGRLKGRKTMVIIAHRLSTVRDCDRIYYIDRGRIVASGTFDELVAKEDGFADMVRLMSVAPRHGDAADAG